MELGKMLNGCLFGFSAEQCGVKVWCAVGTPTTLKCDQFSVEVKIRSQE